MNPRVKRLIDIEKMKQEHDLGIGFLYNFRTNTFRMFSSEKVYELTDSGIDFYMSSHIYTCKFRL